MAERKRGTRKKAATRSRKGSRRAGTTSLEALWSQLEPLLEVPAVSGAEGELAERFAALLEKAGATVEIDASGNVIGRKGARPSHAVVCHLDAVGWMVERKEEGSCQLCPVGGVTPSAMQRATLVTVAGQRVPGLVLSGKGGADPVFEPLDPSWMEHVQVGDRVSYAATYDRDGPFLQGPYLDNRLGCWMALAAMAAADELAVVATVQEEVTGQGAYHCRQALEGVEDVLIVDVTYSQAYGIDYPIEVGKGPVIGLKDSFMPPQGAVERLRDAAARAGVEMQPEVAAVGGTDAVAFVQWDRPVRWIFLGIPSRYNHQPLEVVDLRDLLGAERVLEAWVAGTAPGRRGTRSRRKTSTKRKAGRRKS